MVAIMSLALFFPAGSVPLAATLCGLAGIGISATQVIPFSILPDVIEYDELINGVRREGTFYGVAFSLLAILAGIVIWLSTTLMGVFGYVENSTHGQPESALTCIRIMTGIGPGIFFIISAIFVKILPITKESHEEVKRQLEERRLSRISDK
jgi:GPH family glycoside/pentoside/hexuronide:cation symporter